MTQLKVQRVRLYYRYVTWSHLYDTSGAENGIWSRSVARTSTSGQSVATHHNNSIILLMLFPLRAVFWSIIFDRQLSFCCIVFTLREKARVYKSVHIIWNDCQIYRHSYLLSTIWPIAILANTHATFVLCYGAKNRLKIASSPYTARSQSLARRPASATTNFYHSNTTNTHPK